MGGDNLMAAKSAVVEMRAHLRMRAVLAMAIAVAFALALSTAAGAATIVVNSLADPGAKGICALRDAITAANTKTATNGCTAGTGKDTIRFSVTGTILLASTLPQVTDRRLTITGPASPGITIDGGNKVFGTGVQVMKVASCATLDLRDLTIAHGFSNPKGGGIINEGTLVVINSTFSSNGAFGTVTNFPGGAGGGIYNDGTLTVTDSTFSSNSAFGTEYPGAGGGIYNDGTLTVTDSTFSGNQSTGPSPGAGEGGGIYNNGTLTVTKSIFSNNLGPAEGGGIANFKILRVTKSTFSDNSTAGCCGSGGGIYNGATGSVTNSTFSGNIGLFAGGGIGNVGTLTVTNSTFVGNIGFGGGIYNGEALIINNSTFSGNSSGAIINTDFASLKNTILAASPDKNCTEFGTGTIIDAGYNISDDASCGFSATGSRNNTNPMLDSKGLQYNGGPTETIALNSESPASMRFHLQTARISS